MERYLEHREEGGKLPQIMGMTASPGAGDNSQLEKTKTIAHLLELAAFMDATSGFCKVSDPENLNELHRFLGSGMLSAEATIAMLPDPSRRELRYLRKQRKKLKERLVVKGGVAEEAGELIRQEHLFKLQNMRKASRLGHKTKGVELELAGGSGQEEGSEEEVEDGEEVEEREEDEAKEEVEEKDSEKEVEEREDSEKEVEEREDKEKEGKGEISDEDDNEDEVEKVAEERFDSENSKEVPTKRKRKLDPEGLAIGAVMVQSKKKREDLIESGYNRWTSNDENLPDWFMEDENKFCQKRLPITKEMVEVYRAKLKEINIRPIKKVAEAKARKKKRALKSLEKARKRAESISDALDISSQEKAQQIKQIYKKAGTVGKRKRENVEYVVAKRGVGRRVKRPAGVKGRFKVVDPRMKKDNRGNKGEKKGGKNKAGAARAKKQQKGRKR